MSKTTKKNLYQDFYKHYSNFTDDLYAYQNAKKKATLSPTKIKLFESQLRISLLRMSNDINIAVLADDKTFKKTNLKRLKKLVWYTEFIDKTDFFVEINDILSNLLAILEKN